MSSVPPSVVNMSVSGADMRDAILNHHYTTIIISSTCDNPIIINNKKKYPQSKLGKTMLKMEAELIALK